VKGNDLYLYNIRQPNNKQYYLTTQNNQQLAGAKIVITTSDLPGNITKGKIILA
jgi:hypothetical protein